MKALSPRDPKKIGDFTIVSRLGAGGMGDVYLGERDGENVAIKVIRDSFADDPAYVARFTREITILQTVSHPNVISFVDSGLDDGRWWYASEFAHGPSLDVMVKKSGPLSEDAWEVLATGLLAGLRAIHDHNIVHRDIKPANIIMSPYGPKIIDLGVARGDDETSLTNTGMAPGSPAWFSPEQVLGQEVTPASDCFSAGAVLTFAATGRGPWGTPSSVNYENIGTKIFSTPDLTGLSESQKIIVSSLLQPEPAARLAAVQHRSSPPKPVTNRRPRAETERHEQPDTIPNPLKSSRTGLGFPKRIGNGNRVTRLAATGGIILVLALVNVSYVFLTVGRDSSSTAGGASERQAQELSNNGSETTDSPTGPGPYVVEILLPMRLAFEDAAHSQNGRIPCLPATASSPAGDALILSSGPAMILAETTIRGYEDRLSNESLAELSRQVGSRMKDLGTLSDDGSRCVYSAFVSHRVSWQEAHRIEIQGESNLTKLTTRSELQNGIFWNIDVWP